MIIVMINVHMTAVNFYDQAMCKSKRANYYIMPNYIMPRERERSEIGELNLIDWVNHFFFGPCSLSGPSIEY